MQDLSYWTMTRQRVTTDIGEATPPIATAFALRGQRNTTMTSLPHYKGS